MGLDCLLPPNTGFLLRIWREDGKPLGAMDAISQQSQIKCTAGVYTYEVGDLRSAPGIELNPTGKFYWDVIPVSLEPYQELITLTVTTPPAWFELTAGSP
jgi:hypothetical protein